MPQFLWPGHNYLGPGNPLENGEPVDEADRIAQRHDIAYNQAKSTKDIYNSDRTAIYEFGKDFLSHPNTSSLAGAVGLSLKHITEAGITGLIYPNL